MMSWFRRPPRLAARARAIEYIATDLDGTLLDDDSTIPGENLDEIAALRAQSIEVLLATGRTDGFARSFARQIGSTAPIISLNGALAMDNRGNVIHGEWIQPRVVEAVLDVIRNHSGTTLTLFTPAGLVSQTFPLILPRYLRACPEEHLLVEMISDFFPRTVMMVATGAYAVVQEVSVTLAATYKGRFDRTSYQSRQDPELYYVEIRNKGVSKGRTLRAILPEFRATRKQIAAIGDYANDLEMCRMAGLSAAMSNGIAELRSSVDFVTQKTNNDAGAAEFFRLIRDAHAEAR